MRQIIIIAHNLRSTHNVGSLFRTAEGLGIFKLFLTGYTPHPRTAQDSRLPHSAVKTERAIAKTALGAESTLPWEYCPDITPLLHKLKNDGWLIAALEQTADSILLPAFKPPDKLVVILGREVEGVEQEVMNCANAVLEIPMFGLKESFNVVQAAAMVMYHCRFYDSQHL